MQSSGKSCRENADVHLLLNVIKIHTTSLRDALPQALPPTPPPYPGNQPRIAGRKKIAILIAKPMLHRIERSVGRLPR
jgi:hypothetical protein